MNTKGLLFPKPKDIEQKKEKKIYYMKKKSSKRAKAVDIPIKVKKEVFLRDKGKCIICGQIGIPNSHFIKRSHGGLGIPENIVCMCVDCHNAYDNGFDNKKTEMIRDKTKSYLKRQYGRKWKEENLVYKKE